MILYENMDICACAQDAEFFKKRGSYDMIPHGKEIKVFTGSSNPELADMICKNLGISLGKSTVTAFADGECSISINEPVRGVDVFIVQSTCKPVNDSLMELLVMIDAMKRASAGRITAVIPYFGYARQDRKAKARDPISAKLVANLLTIAGADRVLTMDLHAAQIQGFFDIPVDNLYGAPLFASHYLRRFGYGREDLVVVSPDVGSVARARSFAMKMGLGLAIVDKRREKANCSEVMNIIGNVEGKTCLLLDDMVDTAGSLCGAAKAIVEVGGATEVFACASHGVLSGPGVSVGGAIVDSGNFDWLKYADKYPGLTTPDDSYHGIVYVEKFGKLGYITKATSQLMRDLGSIQSPQNAFYVMNGLESLHVRMERHCKNALEIAKFLKANDKVAWVDYPDLEDDKYHALAEKYLPNGSCGVLSFAVKGGRDCAVKFMDSLKLCDIETHVADAKTCILHPASHTHRQMTDEQLIEAGVAPDLIRLSVGLENVDDLIADISQALDKI